MKKTYKKGDIIYFNQKNSTGSIQGGRRPYLIVSNDTYNYYSPVINAVPLSTRINKKSPVHYFLSTDTGIKVNSVVLIEQITTICKEECENVITHLSDAIMQDIDNLIKFQFAIL